jgi:hypothetical protein
MNTGAPAVAALVLSPAALASISTPATSALAVPTPIAARSTSGPTSALVAALLSRRYGAAAGG